MLLRIQLIKSGIKIQIKSRHAVTGCGKNDPVLPKLLKTFIQLLSAVYKSLQCFGTNDVGILLISI